MIQNHVEKEKNTKPHTWNFPIWLTLHVIKAVSPICAVMFFGIPGSKYGPVYRPVNFFEASTFVDCIPNFRCRSGWRKCLTWLLFFRLACRLLLPLDILDSCSPPLTVIPVKSIAQLSYLVWIHWGQAIRYLTIVYITIQGLIQSLLSFTRHSAKWLSRKLDYNVR